MLLSKFFGNWNKKSLPPITEEESFQNLPKHQQARKYVDRLLDAGEKTFNPLKAGVVTLSTIESDLYSLTERIYHYTEKIEDKIIITPADCYTELNTVTLETFLTDKNGNYLSRTVISAFAQQCQLLFTAIDNSTNMEYTLRLMRKCFVSICNVCQALEDTRN